MRCSSTVLCVYGDVCTKCASEHVYVHKHVQEGAVFTQAVEYMLLGEFSGCC